DGGWGYGAWASVAVIVAAEPQPGEQGHSRPRRSAEDSAETTVERRGHCACTVVPALHRCFEALQCAHAPAFFRAFVMATLIWAKIGGRKRSPNVRLKTVKDRKRTRLNSSHVSISYAV